MATNFIQEGNVIDWYNAGSAVASGAVVQVGFRGMGVALAAIGALGTGSVMIDGVFDLPLDDSDTTAIGGKAWWDGSKALNDPAAGRFFIGFFTEVRADAPNQTVGVKLAPFTAEGVRALVTPTTAAQTLAAANFLSGHCAINAPNAEAQTITLPALATVPAGALLHVLKSGANTDAVTLDGHLAETIAGATTHATMNLALDSVTLAATAAGWIVVGSAVA